MKYILFCENIPVIITLHNEQTRNDGVTPYFLHPVEVATKLMKWGIDDEAMLLAALYHDVIEDTDTEEGFVKLIIGEVATQYVVRLTKPDDKPKDEYAAEIAEGCIRPLIIKIADRICNIMDFYTEGDKYYKVYHKKSKVLFDAFYNRRGEIERCFGNIVFTRIKQAIEDLPTGE